VKRLTRREVAILLVAAAAGPAVILGRAWRDKAALHGQDRAEPFRIAGNFYFVGATDVSIFLITGPAGHVLIDGGYATTAPMVMASIAELGFDIRDVRVLLNSSPRPDQAGGLMALQQASGGAVWASEASADVIAAGGVDPDMAWPLRTLFRAGLGGYPPARVDHRVGDGATIRVGPIALTAHVTGGAARGCTSWTFPVRDGDRVLNVVSVCDLDVTLGMRYPEQAADLERSFAVLRGLPADIWVTSHGRAWGRYRKFAARASARNSVEPFIDREGYRAFIDDAETALRLGKTH
jgi:metallo-beta-lactamase class B